MMKSSSSALMLASFFNFELNIEESKTESMWKLWNRLIGFNWLSFI